MRRSGIFVLAMMVMLFTAACAQAQSGWQCAPYAREITPVTIRGNAWTWWGQAEGRYERGNSPQIGSVMVFKRSGAMPYGHVAVVRRVVSDREVILEHANWAAHGSGNRGKVKVGDRAIDISPNNDWTSVRVWHSQSGNFGRANPVYGFIYAPEYDPRTGIEWHAAEENSDDAG